MKKENKIVKFQEAGNTRDDNTVRDIDNPYFIKGFDSRIKKDFPSILRERRKLNISILLNCQDIEEDKKDSVKNELNDFTSLNGNTKIKVFIKEDNSSKEV